MIFVFALVAIASSAAIAKDQSTHPLMYQNLNDMSALLGDISAQLRTGKMTPEAQKTAAKITQGISHMLQDLAGLGNGIHYKHQAEIKKMKKSWNPFAEESATND
jgi:hypothetical protein